jgi:hypothetical protein
MQPEEAIQLLQTGLVIEPAGQEAQLIQQLTKRLGEWPLLLTLANGVLRERVGRLREPLLAALTYLQRALEKRGVVAFDARNAQERRQAVAKTIEVSLEQLGSDEQARFEELAIFPKDVTIPLITVHHLWQATAHLDELDTEDLCQRLSSLSLLQSYDLHARSIGLHDVIRGYLQLKAQAQLPTLHKRFLDAYGLECWADLAADECYLWDHLAEHLVEASQFAELVATVKDLRYLAYKTLIKHNAYAAELIWRLLSNGCPLMCHCACFHVTLPTWATCSTAVAPITTLLPSSTAALCICKTSPTCARPSSRTFLDHTWQAGTCFQTCQSRR